MDEGDPVADGGRVVGRIPCGSRQPSDRGGLHAGKSPGRPGQGRLSESYRLPAGPAALGTIAPRQHQNAARFYGLRQASVRWSHAVPDPGRGRKQRRPPSSAQGGRTDDDHAHERGQQHHRDNQQGMGSVRRSGPKLRRHRHGSLRVDGIEHPSEGPETRSARGTRIVGAGTRTSRSIAVANTQWRYRWRGGRSHHCTRRTPSDGRDGGLAGSLVRSEVAVYVSARRKEESQRHGGFAQKRDCCF
mmetsp:Transcript_11291/g.25620  ORF Transcript_11291/g.25620 Transcript_11291/m.25620 type:complete len:245 (+) Transcript_11291:548-1282(+)